MSRLTGLLIDPHLCRAEVVRFAPDLAEFYRLLQTDRIAGFADEEHGLSYTLLDEVAEDERAIVFCRGWDYPVRGRVLVTGLSSCEIGHRSLSVPQLEWCRAAHHVGWITPNGIKLL